MGNKPLSPVGTLCSTIQQNLVNEREIDSSRSETVLPRSTKIDGRFVLTKEHFPDYIEQNSLYHLYEWRKNAEPLPTYTENFLQEKLPVIKPNDELLKRGATAGNMQVTWLGHASVLSQWDGWNVLADPIFSERCSPSQLIGPKRLRPAPIDASSLPKIDVCVISHNHYDHLDELTVLSLVEHHPDMIFAVPLGMKQWMEDIGVRNVIEFDWSESVEWSDPTDSGRPLLRIRCLPCQHWCSRTKFDYNQCLWSSWAVSTVSGSLFFGGDTGYCSMFKKVEKVVPDIAVAALPIGAYGSPKEQWFHKYNHMNPSEAVQTHLDLNASASVAVHWGTFMLTGEDILEPLALLEQAKESLGVDAQSFVALQHGETRSFPFKQQVADSETIVDTTRK